MKTCDGSPAGRPCIAQTDPAELVCRECLRPKAIDEFRRRSQGGTQRIRQCRSCHAYAERLRRYGKRSAGHNREMRKMLTRLRRARSQREVEIVCAAMVAAFGGPQRFLARWTRQAAAELPKGGLAAFRHLDAILRLIRYSDQRAADRVRSEGAWLRSLSDTELESLLPLQDPLAAP